MKPIKLAVGISDTHCGSEVGMLPPGFVTLGGNEIAQNSMQRWLWDCWGMGMDFIGKVVDGDPFILIINGDGIEGVHHGGRQLISNNIIDHFNCAEELFRPLTKEAKKVFVVKGTECHTGNTEDGLAKVLGAERNPDTNKKSGADAFDRLQVEIHGCPCAFSHHIGTSVRDYTEATQFSIVANQELVAAARNKEAPPRVIVRSHRHRFGAFTNGHEMVVVTPPWQAQTRHVHKVVTGVRCHPGIVIFDWRESEPGGLPRLHHKIYEQTPQTTIRV